MKWGLHHFPIPSKPIKYVFGDICTDPFASILLKNKEFGDVIIHQSIYAQVVDKHKPSEVMIYSHNKGIFVIILLKSI